MRAKGKPPRLPRIERDPPVVVHEDENANLWAVSYADFLMTVLSFFILFYSVDDSKKKVFILNLAKEFSTAHQMANQSGPNDGKAGSQIERIPSSISDSLKNFNVKVDRENEVLIVNFADNLFLPGEFKIAKANENEIKNLLTRIKPYDGKISLYFEGHADDTPIRMHKNSVVTDNFVLSSLRASSALSMAKSIGFSEKNLFIQADSSNVRNSRTLSLRIEPVSGSP